GITSARRFSIPVTTDDAGRFHFDCLPEGLNVLSSDPRKGFRLVTRGFEVLPLPSGTEIEVHAVTLESISGGVFDGAGRPAAADEVSVVGPRTSTTGQPCTRTRSDGSFDLFRDERVGDKVDLATGQLATPFEPTVQPEPIAWNAHGVRLRAVTAQAIEI